MATCEPLIMLVVVNDKVWSTPFKVTAICGFPWIVNILHKSHTFLTLNLWVETNTYDGGRPSGNTLLVTSDKSTFDVISYPFIFVAESWILFLTFFFTPKPKSISNPFSSRAATGIRVGQTDSSHSFCFITSLILDIAI